MKKFQDLDMSNAFLFAAALEDPELCQMVIEIVLDEAVGTVKVKVERTILFNSDFRFVRLDVYATDSVNVEYNIEMQNKNEGKLPKRSRYHQAEMDLSSLKPGDDFNDSQPSVIIFICSFDPFGYKLFRYTFEERCKEVDIPLGDGTKKIFLSTKGENPEDVPAELVHFLKYVEKSTDECVEQANDEKLAKLHKKVKTLKQSRDLEARYMLFEELLQQERNDGKAEGKADGELLKLIALVRKKQDKGLDAATIAEHLEEPVEYVEKILGMIQENPSAGDEEILDKVR